MAGRRGWSIVVSDDAIRVSLRVDLESKLGRFSAVRVGYRGPRCQWPPRRHLRGVF